MNKVTKKEMYIALIKGLQENVWDYPQEDMVDFCYKQIEALEKKAEKAKETAAKKKASGDEMTELIKGVLSDTEFESIATIVKKLDNEEITTSKATYRLTQLVKAGYAEKDTITVGEDKRKIMGYRLASNMVVETDEIEETTKD